MLKFNLAATARTCITFHDVSNISYNINLEIFLIDICIMIACLVCTNNKVLHISHFFIGNKCAVNAYRSCEADFSTSCFLDHCYISKFNFCCVKQLSKLCFVNFTITTNHNSDSLAINVIDQCLNKLVYWLVERFNNFFNCSRIRCFNKFHFKFCFSFSWFLWNTCSNFNIA